MFESLKKKFSSASDKLTKEIKEEAQNENNIKSIVEEISKQDLKKAKKELEKEDNSKEVKEKISQISNKETPNRDKKNSFFSFGNNKNKNDEPSGDDKKDKLFSFGKNKDSNNSKLFSFISEKTISEKHLEDVLWELEMGLLEGDVAMDVATKVVESVKNNLIGQKIKRSKDIEEYTLNALKNAVEEIINITGKNMTEMIKEKKDKGEPLVVMFVGINGTGKTTTIGKLANFYLKKGYVPVIAASDTFRAGAIEQVTQHADNVGVKVIKHKKGSDPAAIAFDAVAHAKAQGKELVLIDTAGRMQTNTNLMDEMKKIKRVSKPDLVIFVGDALTGNDATEQATKFNDAIDIDGVILTKADADSKGGASFSIGYVIKKPIMFLGIGQGYDDIKEYDPKWMLNQLFSKEETKMEIEE